MTVYSGITGYIQRSDIKLGKADRAVMLNLWREFMKEEGVRVEPNGDIHWKHEHPALPFKLFRGFKRRALNSFVTTAKFAGTGWEITFAHRLSDAGEGIDWNTCAWLGEENNFDHEWTLGFIKGR